MKNFIVGALTTLVILGVTGLGLVSRSRYEAAPQTASLPDRYGREGSAPSPSAASVERFEEESGKKEMARPRRAAAPKGFGAALDESGLMGAGPGGGGLGTGAGIGGLGTGGLGTRGRGGGGLAEAMAALEAPAEPAPTRAWFPETFLFEPLVVTNDQGLAHVPVKVPDRLTTWRVLALAHSRQGGQAGAVASFLGTLPAYVEPVTPPFLYAGDSVRLPVQVVNTTEAELSSSLAYAVEGATLSATGGAVRVPAGGNAVQYVTLNTTKPGVAVFKATLGSTDAAEKRIDLKPAGRREVVGKAGTLAAPRTFTLAGPVNPLPGTEAVRLRVYPGALGLLRNELAAAIGRGGPAEDAYLLQLLGQAPALLVSLGAKPDEPVIRELMLLATQRVMQDARSPSVDTATLLTEAALSHPQNPVLTRLGERLALQVVRRQRADGTCEGETGWTLQRLLVATTECVRAVRAAGTKDNVRATAMTLKAAGAFERNAARVSDGYTAAAILASGAVTGGTADALRKLVLEKLTESSDGGKSLQVDPGVVRADGVAPSTPEATAMAILALQDVKDAPLADLGTSLLAGYSPYSGWGDGRANLVALRAAVRLFKDPVPAGVKISLERDGTVLAGGALDADSLQSVLVVDADAAGSGGEHAWTVRAEPPVPGLGYSLQLVSYSAWKDAPGGGLELKTELPRRVTVGQRAEVKLTAAVPGGVPMKLELALPAGAAADSTSLARLTSSGTITRYETEDGLLTLHLPPQPNGALWQSTLDVVATLAGTLQSGASSLAPESAPTRKKEFAPVTWKVE